VPSFVKVVRAARGLILSAAKEYASGVRQGPTQKLPRRRRRARRRDGTGARHDGACLIEVPIDPHDCSKSCASGAAAWPSPTAALREPLNLSGGGDMPYFFRRPGIVILRRLRGVTTARHWSGFANAAGVESSS